MKARVGKITSKTAYAILQIQCKGNLLILSLISKEITLVDFFRKLEYDEQEIVFVIILYHVIRLLKLLNGIFH